MMKLLSKKQVRAIILLSFAHIDRLEKTGNFPKRIRLGDYPSSRVGWIEQEILDWLNERIRKRSQIPV